MFGHNSPADRAREIFKTSEDVESLQVSICKKWEDWDWNFSWSDVRIGIDQGYFDDVIGAWEKNLSLKG